MLRALAFVGFTSLAIVTGQNCGGHRHGELYPLFEGACLPEYYHCNAGIQVKKSCAAGTVFDDDHDYCGWPADVASCSEIKERKCTDKYGNPINGISFTDPYNCEDGYYYSCEYGVKVEKKCPTGRIFDEFRQLCLLEAEVEDCKILGAVQSSTTKSSATTTLTTYLTTEERDTDITASAELPPTTAQAIVEETTVGLPTSCEGLSLHQIPPHSRSETGGVIQIEIPRVGPTNVYCDVATDGGNWIVFQRRMDGSVNFYRYWNDYVNGFGDPNKEHWMGLEALHQLTKDGHYEMRIDMIRKDTDEQLYAKYSYFKIGASSDNYRLHLSGYHGNATDAMADKTTSGAYHSTQEFTTRDADNDNWSGNCAEMSKGAWWYDHCQHSNLNGMYSGGSRFEGVRWYNAPDGYDMNMSVTEMKFRRRL